MTAEVEVGSSDDGGGITGMVIVIVVGLVFAGIGGYMYTEQRQALQEHEPVDATVVSTDIDREVDRNNQNNRREVNYYATVTYEYEVDGETHRSSNVRPAGIQESYDTRSGAENFLADYEEGAQVTAYYDPDTHSEAFLLQEESMMPLVFGGLGVLAVIGGVVGFLKQLLGLLF